MEANKLIACCGINCEGCDARKATMNNDDNLRKETAAKWQKMFNAPSILPETINCTGCRTEGENFFFCSNCEARNCVRSKGFETCADCCEMDSCSIIGGFFQHDPQLKVNLEAMRN